MSEDTSEVRRLATDIHRERPSRLIFLDHVPHPDTLLAFLDDLYEGNPLPELTVHVFGDFTLYPARWMAIEPVLRKTKVKFICASERQKALIRKLMVPEAEGALSLCPFPVDSDFFDYDPELRARKRNKFGVKPGDRIIVYTGRISLQKNVSKLTVELARLLSESNRDFYFFIAGAFDDLSAPFFGIHHSRGTYFQYWQKRLQSLSPKFQSRVRFLGNLDGKSLRDLYNASDLYCSLSLHHDEDYGMAPAEALCCGLPVVLTSWGGYASFAGSEEDCGLVPVRISRTIPEIATGRFRDLVNKRLKRQDTDDERRGRANRYQRKISVNAAADILAKILAEPGMTFQGFSWFMKQYAEISKTGAPFNRQRGLGSFYEEIYRNYIGTRNA